MMLHAGSQFPGVENGGLRGWLWGWVLRRRSCPGRRSVPDWRRRERPGGGAGAPRGGDADGLRVRHHLALVGRTDPLFSDDAIARLHRAAACLPRALNNAAVAALIAASEGKALVDGACAKNAVAELTKAD